MKIRTGQGIDVHKFATGRKLILGGVEIPYKLGLDGHSDADVAVHAVMDAILGALALGDIGKWFPDSDELYSGANSLKLLDEIVNSAEFAGWMVGNLDVTLIAQAPKLADYIDAMRANLAGVLNCEINQVSVKATTTERLGFCGREEGIAASAVLLLEK